MPVNVEMWQPIVQEELFKSNEFLKTFYNADEYVVGGRIVHIPQSGGPSNVEKNRSTLPATVSDRVDTDVTYPLDEYTTDPRRISNIDQVELSYNKMSSIVSEDTSAIMERAGDNILYDVSKDCIAAAKIAATGAQSAATAPSATGTRTIYTAADFRAARTYLNKLNVPKNNRYAVVTSECIDQLQSDPDLTYAFQQIVNIAEGTLPKIYGFQLIERSDVLVLDNTQTIKPVGAAAAATDSEGILFYQQNMLEKALGDITIFEQMKSPTYYGDIISFLVRVGARKRRADDKGYGVIYRSA